MASPCAASGSRRRSPQAQVNLVERLLGAVRCAADARGAARALPTRARHARADLTDARLRELEPPSADEGFVVVERGAVPARAGRSGPSGRLRRGGARAPRLGRRAREADRRAVPRVRLEPRRPPDALAPAVARLAPLVSGPVRGRAVPASRRTAELLVPAAASRAAPRLRARLDVDPARSIDRHGARPPDPGDDTRRPVRRAGGRSQERHDQHRHRRRDRRGQRLPDEEPLPHAANSTPAIINCRP